METRITVAFAFACAVTTLAAGCMSKPYPDFSSVAESIRKPFSRPADVAELSAELPTPVRSVASNSASTTDFGGLTVQLQSADAEARVQACQGLGEIATQGQGNFEAMDLLTKVMQSDPSADVRVAATNALLAIEDPRAVEPLDALVAQQEESLEEPVERLSLLKKLWR